MHTSSYYIVSLTHAGLAYKVRATLNTSIVHVCTELCIIVRKAGYLRHGHCNSCLMPDFQNLFLYCSLHEIKCIKVFFFFFKKASDIWSLLAFQSIKLYFPWNHYKCVPHSTSKGMILDWLCFFSHHLISDLIWLGCSVWHASIWPATLFAMALGGKDR